MGGVSTQNYNLNLAGMEIQEALQWTDKLIFTRTGKHLDSLQRAIVEGVWEGKGYKDISDEYHCSSDHVRKSASELWKLLSDLLGEDVKKKNVRSLLENGMFYSFNNTGVQIGNNINVCSDRHNPSKIPRNRSPSTPSKPPQPCHNLSQAPEYPKLQNRTEELATLKQWILEEKSRIVTLTGLSGMGKTALARQLVEDIKDNFDRILWHSHRQFTTLNALKTNILEFLAPSSSSQNPVILESLRNHRCLIILDDFHETLTPGEFVGNYRPEYEKYGQFLQAIGQFPHNSCLLLLTWEKPLEIATLETENPYCKTFPVPGLGDLATPLLKQRQLQDPRKWSDLIQLYNGNPLWLKIIASTILDLFNGSVQQFLAYPTLFLGDLEPILKQHYQRISESEKILLHWLANQEKPVEISQKPPDLLSDSDFLKAIQSLQKRSLLEKSPILSLQPAIEQYVKNWIP